MSEHKEGHRSASSHLQAVDSGAKLHDLLSGTHGRRAFVRAKYLRLRPHFVHCNRKAAIRNALQCTGNMQWCIEHPASSEQSMSQMLDNVLHAFALYRCCSAIWDEEC